MKVACNIRSNRSSVHAAPRTRQQVSIRSKVPPRSSTRLQSQTRVRQLQRSLHSPKEVSNYDGILVSTEGTNPSKAFKTIDTFTGGELQRMWQVASQENTEDAPDSGPCVTFFGLKAKDSDLTIPRVTVIKTPGKEIPTTKKKEIIRRAAAQGAKLLKGYGAKKIAIESFGNSQCAAEGSILATWKYDELKSKKGSPVEVSQFVGEDTDASDSNWERGKIIANAQIVARTLSETPSNLMTPSIFAERAIEAFSNIPNTKVVVREKAWIEEQKMGCLLGVTRGSAEPPKFLEIHYTGGASSDPALALVGKGITFDTGGYSIKGAQSMINMKGDMGGGSVVLSSILGLSKLSVATNVSGFIPLCENMVSGTAIKPGDVLRAMNGKTVEVDNTDAEGRLVLADALHYAHSFKPHTILDLATLTGAIGVALGTEAFGVFTDDVELWNSLDESGYATGEKCWRMPLWPGYKKGLKSQIADMRNVGGRDGGACVAAVFLKEFVSMKRWAHLDIAGVDHANDSQHYINKGMTGIPTRAIIEFASKFAQREKYPNLFTAQLNS